MSDNVYWTMKNGQKINVDDMDINHLRNTLKMIIKSRTKTRKIIKPEFKLYGDIATEFNDSQEFESYDSE